MLRCLMLMATLVASATVSLHSSAQKFCFASLSAGHCAATNGELSPSPDAVEVDVAGQISSSDWLVESLQWIDETQHYVSQTVQNTAVNIDRYIARDSFDELAVNESYVRLRLLQRIGQAGQQTTEARISGKIDLPNSKRKVKLIFDSDPDDFDSLEQKQRDISVGSELFDKSRSEAAVGLALERDLEHDWKMSLGGGVRLRSALDPYTRLRFTRHGKWAEHWLTRIRETLFYYDSKSWGAETELDLYRPLDNDRLLHLALGGKYLDSDDNWEWIHGMSVNRRLDRNNAVEYQVGVSANSKPSTRVSNYWLRGKWQHRLYQNWLYLSVVPEVSFPRDRHFSASYQLTAELEMYFSKDLDLRNKRIRY